MVDPLPEDESYWVVVVDLATGQVASTLRDNAQQAWEQARDIQGDGTTKWAIALHRKQPS
jgi:hypothetical protein